MYKHLWLGLYFSYICFNHRWPLTMKLTYTWLMYSFLCFGPEILCDRKYDGSCSINAEDEFKCPNGVCIESSRVCDGRKDCSDGADETKASCDRYEYEIDITMDCGRVNAKNQGIIGKGMNKATAETTPWYVGIYGLNKTDSYYNLICGGSIIAPNLVISAAHCFGQYDTMRSKKISIKDGLIKVSVGKYDRNFTVINNNFTQIINVKTIYHSDGYWGMINKHANDIAVIVLAHKVSFSNGVTPVCVDWKSEYNVVNGAQGKIVVWGQMKNGIQSVLLEQFLPYINTSTCREMYLYSGFDVYVTYDKFCAGSKLVSGQGVSVEDSGVGITFLHSNSYFLSGVLSIKDTVKNSSILGFTDINEHLQWIRGLFNFKHITDSPCVLPAVEGVVYSYEGSNEILSHGTIVKYLITVIENCEVGYHQAYPNGFRVCRGNGKWLSNSEKLCFKMCPPLESDSLDIKCSHNGKYANCSNLSIPDTIATPSCKPTYTAPNGQDDIPFELLCQSDGTWNKQLYRCNPYCGRVYILNLILISNGEKALVGTAPWNVGIYRLNKINSDYDFICGGSIIAPNLVVSAAHCFWQKGMISNRISVNDGLYTIAVGKYARDFTVIDNDFTKIINVDMIYLKEGYYGPTGFHAEDIAIIVLRNRVSFSNGVAPVCIDWNGRFNVSNGDQGKIVGWGKTEKGISSPVLLEASLPFIDHRSCRDMYTNGFESFVTVDKFCAGSALVSGQGVGKGDSGAGLSFLHSNSYYLTGVVSIKDPNTENSIAVFTEVKYHIQWIRGLYKKHN
eukprot:XP_016658568.1 PREDICTED: complement C1s-A subcomponent isoform X2 [Acyrthosiphon pisum]